MIAFVDEHRSVYGVEPICKVLSIAPSTYYAHAAIRADAGKASILARLDKELCDKIREIFSVYGACKVWRQLLRDGEKVARRTVARLMKHPGLRGVVRDKTVPCAEDKVNRAFAADKSNQLWVADFTYARTWLGFVYIAFIVDVFARKIVGWNVSASRTAKFVVDALQQAIDQRKPQKTDSLIHHSDKGSQYVSFTYTERLCQAKIQPSTGSVGTPSITLWQKP